MAHHPKRTSRTFVHETALNLRTSYGSPELHESPRCLQTRRFHARPGPSPIKILTVPPQPTPAHAHPAASQPARTLTVRRLLPLLALLIALAACAAPVPLPHPAPPPGSSPYIGDGPLETAAQLAFTDLHSRLTRHYEKPWDIQRHAIPPDTGWDSITAHYTKALGPDWQVDTRYPENSTGYRARVWSADGRAVAIGLVPGRQPTAEHVLIVLLPEDENR